MDKPDKNGRPHAQSKPQGISMKMLLLTSLLLAAIVAFQNPSATTPERKPKPPEPAHPTLSPEEQIEYESLLPTVDVSKVHVEGACYPARDNGDGTCTRIIYSLQPGATCTAVPPSGTRTLELNCTYKKPKAWSPPPRR